MESTSIHQEIQRFWRLWHWLIHPEISRESPSESRKNRNRFGSDLTTVRVVSPER